MKELEAIAPIKDWALEDTRVYDFGQNVAGYPRITVSGAPWAKVIIDFGEVLAQDGSWDNRNYRRARATLTYTLAGQGTEIWWPVFTFQGYRYARVRIEGRPHFRISCRSPQALCPMWRADSNEASTR
ncbi:family 78 glycoside hydrolase catalytic domain [Roseisalinus antarcticus]|uniref:family 78 glycoside hydrolase catalytic domain n=1 Tax=Roseisalinus antarcticus TaxID=254357 RepID=UPI00135629D4|nr:family 78 glycoside hydrolase catalytic domain [Roseisalinus antarcticus]